MFVQFVPIILNIISVDGAVMFINQTRREVSVYQSWLFCGKFSNIVGAE